jgi:hypothetical protein
MCLDRSEDWEAELSRIILPGGGTASLPLEARAYAAPHPATATAPGATATATTAHKRPITRVKMKRLKYLESFRDSPPPHVASSSARRPASRPLPRVSRPTAVHPLVKRLKCRQYWKRYVTSTSTSQLSNSCSLFCILYRLACDIHCWFMCMCWAGQVVSGLHAQCPREARLPAHQAERLSGDRPPLLQLPVPQVDQALLQAGRGGACTGGHGHAV